MFDVVLQIGAHRASFSITRNAAMAAPAAAGGGGEAPRMIMALSLIFGASPALAGTLAILINPIELNFTAAASTGMTSAKVCPSPSVKVHVSMSALVVHDVVTSGAISVEPPLKGTSRS